MDLNSDKLQELYRQALSVSSNEKSDEFTFPLQQSIKNVEIRYKELGDYASGGIKKIIRAEDNLTQRTVAKAVMLKKQTPENIEAFFREAVINSYLEHPNIMPVYDLGFDPAGSPFFIMKFIEGNDLSQILKELKKRNPYFIDAYPLSELLGIFVKICDAVSYAHSRNVVHRDLKPANIKIGGYGEVLVCDWGLGKIIGQDQDATEVYTGLDADIYNDITLDGFIKGTPGYIAPEQIVSEKLKDDKLSDIYALGAILYSILSYKPPFAGMSAKEIIYATVEDRLPAPSEVSSNTIPFGLEAVVDKAMNFKPSQRYRSVDDLKKEVVDYQSGFATKAESAAMFTLLKLFYRRNKKLFIISFGATISLITVTILFMTKLKENEQEALKSLRLYESAREENKRTSMLYHSAKSEQGKMAKQALTIKQKNRLAINTMLDLAKERRHDNNLLSALKTVDKVLLWEPNNQTAVKLKMELCISLARFDSVLKMASIGMVDENEPLVKLAKKNSTYFIHKDGRLRSLKRTMELAEELAKIEHTETAEEMLRQFGTPKKTEDIKHILECWLKIENPRTQEINIDIKELNSGELAVSLAANKKLSSIKALKNFQIKTLDISNTSVTTISHITPAPFLRSLDVSGIDNFQFEELSKLVSLTKLIVNKNQLNLFSQKKLHGRIRVISSE